MSVRSIIFLFFTVNFVSDTQLSAQQPSNSYLVLSDRLETYNDDSAQINISQDADRSEDGFTRRSSTTSHISIDTEERSDIAHDTSAHETRGGGPPQQPSASQKKTVEIKRGDSLYTFSLFFWPEFFYAKNITLLNNNNADEFFYFRCIPRSDRYIQLWQGNIS